MYTNFVTNRRKTLNDSKNNWSLMRFMGACSSLMAFVVGGFASSRRRLNTCSKQATATVLLMNRLIFS